MLFRWDLTKALIDSDWQTNIRSNQSVARRARHWLWTWSTLLRDRAQVNSSTEWLRHDVDARESLTRWKTWSIKSCARVRECNIQQQWKTLNHFMKWSRSVWPSPEVHDKRISRFHNILRIHVNTFPLSWNSLATKLSVREHSTVPNVDVRSVELFMKWCSSAFAVLVEQTGMIRQRNLGALTLVQM
jgi:hypothetical protein